MKRFAAIGFAVAIATPSFALAAPSQAAHPPQPQAMPPAQASAPKISDTEFNNFVKAYEALRPIRMKYVQELHQTKDKQKQKQLREEGMKEMKQKISTFMPVSEYVKVGRAINMTPALRKRFMQAIGAETHRRPPAAGTGG